MPTLPFSTLTLPLSLSYCHFCAVCAAGLPPIRPVLRPSSPHRACTLCRQLSVWWVLTLHSNTFKTLKPPPQLAFQLSFLVQKFSDSFWCGTLCWATPKTICRALKHLLVVHGWTHLFEKKKFTHQVLSHCTSLQTKQSAHLCSKSHTYCYYTQTV